MGNVNRVKGEDAKNVVCLLLLNRMNLSNILSVCVTAWIVFILWSQPAHAREPNPPEIQALVGMKISPKNNTTPGSLADFRRVEGSLLVLDPDNQTWIGMPTLDFGFFDNTPVFILSRISSDKSTEIMDVQMLPKAVLEMQLKDGKVVANHNGYRFSEHCNLLNPAVGMKDLFWIFGLVKPEKGKSDCTHNSRRVFKAWRVDQRNGNIEEIQPDNVQCEYFTMDNCDL